MRVLKDSINYFLKIRKEDVCLICPYFEAFEGMAAIRTPQPAVNQNGSRPEEGPYAKLKLMVSPDYLESFEKVLQSLGKKVWFERILEQN